MKIALFKENGTFDIIEVFVPAVAEMCIEINEKTEYEAVLLNYEI